MTVSVLFWVKRYLTVFFLVFRGFPICLASFGFFLAIHSHSFIGKKLEASQCDHKHLRQVAYALDPYRSCPKETVLLGVDIIYIFINSFAVRLISF